jgi:cell division protein FtsA
MSHNSIVAGLDIGATRVTEVIARVRDEGEIDVLGVGEEPCQGLRRGVIVDIDQVASAIATANKRATRMAGVNIRSVFVGVPAIRISCATSHGMTATSGDDWRVTAFDIKQALDGASVLAVPPDREIIAVLPQEYIVDGLGGIQDPEGMTGIRLEVNAKVITGQAAILESIAESAERAGLSVEDRVLEPLAVAEAILTDEQAQRGAMVVDIGGQITQVVTFYEGIPIQFACVPVGGVHITNDIAIGLKIPFEEAERIKQRSSYSQENGNEQEGFIREIIEARLREIMELIEANTREVRNSGLVQCGVFFAGQGSSVPGISELASEILDVPAQIGKCHPVDLPKGVAPDSLSQVALGIIRYIAQDSQFFVARESLSSGFQKALFYLRGWLDEFIKDFF